MSDYLAESYDKALRENDALRQENERLVAANKARAEYLTTRRAGNDVDSYVSLAEAEIAALRSTIDDLTAGEIHTCHDHCQRTACILRRENTALRSRLAEAESLLLRLRAANYRADDIADDIDAFLAAD